MAAPELVCVIPALNEEEAIGPIVATCLEYGVDQVIVGDNESDDGTAEKARAAGAQVVLARPRGYGSACLAALAELPETTRAVLFCDADGSDDLTRIPDLVGPVIRGEADLVIGSRAQDPASKRALTWPQRMGNLVSATLMRILYRVRVSDLGPFRCIDARALQRLQMEDPNFGWTAEMQVKAYRLGLRVHEVPVKPFPRVAGKSKISGNWIAVFHAGWKILSTIVKYHRCDLPEVQPKWEQIKA